VALTNFTFYIKTYTDKHAEERERYLAEKAVYMKQLDQLKEANPL